LACLSTEARFVRPPFQRRTLAKAGAEPKGRWAFFAFVAPVYPDAGRAPRLSCLPIAGGPARRSLGDGGALSYVGFPSRYLLGCRGNGSRDGFANSWPSVFPAVAAANAGWYYCGG